MESLNILGRYLNKANLFSSWSSSDLDPEWNCNYWTSQKYITEPSFCFAFLPALIYHTTYFFGVPRWVVTAHSHSLNLHERENELISLLKTKTPTFHPDKCFH